MHSTSAGTTIAFAVICSLYITNAKKTSPLPPRLPRTNTNAIKANRTSTFLSFRRPLLFFLLSSLSNKWITGKQKVDFVEVGIVS